MALPLYDAHRDIYYDKPRLRGWMHLVGFITLLALGPLLVLSTDRFTPRLVAAVYAGCVTGLFGASAVYHRGQWGDVASRRLQRLDHTMIILLIAGTATPAFALSMPAGLRAPALVVLWALTAGALCVRLMWMDAPERFAGSVYVTLGWVAGAAIPAVWIHNGVAPAAFLMVGGLVYTLGALCYHRRALDFVPSVFGYHESFHACVTLAAACQFIALAGFVI